MKTQRLGAFLRQWWWLWVPGLGLGLRLVYVLLTGKPELAWGDEVTYDLLARNMADGHGFCFVPGQPSLLRAPLYPACLAVLYVIFGHHFMVVLVLQALVGGLSALLLVLLGQRLFDELDTAIVAGCAFACHPLLIFATGLLYSETLYLFLLLLLTYSCLRMVQDAGNRWAVFSGFVLGISVLMKPNLLLFPLLLGCWLWYLLRDLRQALKLGALVTLLMAATILPWVWRNYQVSGALVPVSANGGLNLWQGNHPQADGAAYPLDQVDPLPGYTEVERDSIYREWAIEQIRSEPLHTLSLLPRKLIKFFAPLETSNRGRIPARFGSLIDMGWAIFLGLAVWGGWRVRHNSRKWGLVYLLILYPALLALAIYGGTRYGIVVYPYLFLLAAEPIVSLAQHFKASAITRGKQSA